MSMQIVINLLVSKLCLTYTDINHEKGRHQESNIILCGPIYIDILVEFKKVPYHRKMNRIKLYLSTSDRKGISFKGSLFIHDERPYP